MARPPGKCIFCSGKGLTKEHIFGDWLRELFPRDSSSTHTFGTVEWPKTLITREPRITQRLRQGHPGSRKLRKVCGQCNHGWMSELEDSTKPVLIPLITGQRSRLGPEAQRLLATWAIKTVMVAEWLSPREGQMTLQVDRTWLTDRRSPPERWGVWIATYKGTSWCSLCVHQDRGFLRRSPVRRPSDAVHYVQATTFGVGHILFLVMSSSWRGIHDGFRRIERPGLISIAHTRPRSILWPLARALDDPQANAIANTLLLAGLFDQTLNPGAKWTFTP